MKPNFKLCSKCPHFQCKKGKDSTDAYCTVKHPIPYGSSEQVFIGNNGNIFTGTSLPSSTFIGQTISLPAGNVSGNNNSLSGIAVSTPIFYPTNYSSSSSKVNNLIGKVFKPTVKYTSDKFVPEKSFFVPNECPLHLEHTISQ